jgi:hypothetical protein
MEIIDVGKKILHAIRDGDKVAASQLILELEGMALQLNEENARLRQQVADLEAHIGLVDQMSFDGKVYWRGTGDSREGPFCQKCLDGERRAIRLKHRDETVSGYKSEWFECHNCQSRIEL